MCPAFVKLRLARAQAMDRLRKWLALREILPPTEVAGSEAFDMASDADDNWLGLAIIVHEYGGWTIFNDITGMLSHRGQVSAEAWRTLAGTDDLIYAQYNDAIPFAGYAELRGGQIVCDLFIDATDPKGDRIRGTPSGESEAPRTWHGIASLVDEDEEWVGSPELLWIFEEPALSHHP